MLCKALVLLVFYLCYSSFTLADTTTTSPDTLDLSDGTITSPQYGCPSGTTAAQVNTSNWSTKTVRYGECVNTFAISMAINNALSASGISVDKVHYSWRYLTCFNKPGTFCSTSIANRVNTSTGEVTDDTYWDELTVVIEITDANGTVVSTKTWNMDKWYDWNQANSHSTNEVNVNGIRWQIHEDNIQLYNHITTTGTIYTPNQLGDVRFRVTGQDKGEWNGYYGPVFNKLQTWFTYRANPCSVDTLYDPSCPGYAAAYATHVYNTACAADALYDSGCTGYATAYYNQQCGISALYDSGCTGYATAYFNQQCGISALYNSECTGYAAAYLTQQCGISALYSIACDGYASAYYDQQCGISALYDSGCTGYAAAYLTQQCGISALYDSQCTGYFEAKCDADPLYDFLCTGYQDAYFDQQCTYNPQYDPLCTGYVAPVVETNPEDLIDLGTGTGDSIVDSVISTPDLPITIIVVPPPPVLEITPEPEPEPEPQTPELIIVGPNIIEVVPVVPVEPPTIIEQIEQEIEQELENELALLDPLPDIESDTGNETQDTQEDSSGDVELEVGSNEPNEDSNDSGPEEDGSSVEDTDGDTTEEVVEDESSSEDSTEDETVEEEVVEEEALEEESEESAEDDTVEEEQEETTEEAVEKDEKEETKEETVVAEKKTKKLTKAEKKKAKEKKMREIITEKLKELAIVMGEAQSLEDQQMLQQLIAALINYVPGFDSYGKMAIPGVDFYQSEEIYRDKKIPENQRGLRNGLASELLWDKMVDMQYEGMD